MASQVADLGKVGGSQNSRAKKSLEFCKIGHFYTKLSFFWGGGGRHSQNMLLCRASPKFGWRGRESRRNALMALGGHVWTTPFYFHESPKIKPNYTSAEHSWSIFISGLFELFLISCRVNPKKGFFKPPQLSEAHT